MEINGILYLPEDFIAKTWCQKPLHHVFCIQIHKGWRNYSVTLLCKYEKKRKGANLRKTSPQKPQLPTLCWKYSETK